MEDEGISSGLGSLALYELGRGDERWHQQQANFVTSVTARLRGQVPVNVQALIADNQALRHENAVLRGNNQALSNNLQRYSDNIGEWIERCRWFERELAVLQAERKIGSQ
jgi:hypothetical protein